MKIVLAVAATLALTGLAGCGEDGPSSHSSPDTSFLDDAPTAVVKGRLLKVSGFAGRNPTPIAGTVSLAGQGGATSSSEVGADGTFEIRVRPGTYKVTGTSPQPDGGTAQCAAKATVTTVTADAETAVDVLCYIA